MPIRGMKVIGIYKFEDKLGDAQGVTKTFKGTKVRRGALVEITHMSVVNYTTADKELLLGYEDADGVDHYINKVDQSTGWQAHLNGRLYLLPEERPIAVVTSPGADDVLYCTFHGLIYEYPSQG